MYLFFLGQKIGMTQIFNDTGLAIPVTIIQAGPCIITDIRNIDKNGYNALQIGYKDISPKHVKKPILGHFKKNSLAPLKYLFEVKLNSPSNRTIGELIKVDLFSVGQKVTVTAKSIGRGFAGCQKRHNFSRGPMTHGSKNHRQPGSIGAGTTPGRVIPGKRMPGHLGNRTTTIKNLEVVHIDVENNLLILKGNVPGKSGNIIKICSH
uniref:Large ribosomal subunit protein uL3c n=1 Tax=Compsopogon caeruleus TaxID=31354 RepID=A0A1Z1XB78_9RHOD|nr:ribosomal protein L3 [Compsopogon caeruleus]ARX96076.1 ribosomal protein L3 [Compsopogon caeruleus]